VLEPYSLFIQGLGKSGKAKTPTMRTTTGKSGSRNSKRNLRTTKTHKDEPTMNI
jgi:hypothetical protein